MELSRDMFCFMAFTSIRYSDLKSLCWSDIHGKIMEIVTEKTDERLQIELNDYALEILKKYKKMKQKGNHVFPTAVKSEIEQSFERSCIISSTNKNVG